MKKSKRFVFDTNVVISTFLFHLSSPGKALGEALKRYEVVASAETLEELFNVFKRRKFDKYLPLPMREYLLTKYEQNITFVRVKERIALSRDPDDNKFLSLAKTAKASAIISGDEDLLVLNPFDNIDIITPNEFLKRF